MTNNQNYWAWWFAPPPPPPPPPPVQWDDQWQQDEWPIVPIWIFWRDGGFHSRIKLPEHETVVNEQLFLKLLAWSISLSIDEKKNIIKNFGKLSQFQVDELIKIFEEEKSKFSALDVKHREQLQALERQHAAAWDAFEAEAQQEKNQVVDKAEAEEIRKSLWLN